jgi:hypothetical protein
MKAHKILSTVSAVLLVVLTLSSCEKDPEAGGTAVQSMAGEWWVQLDRAGAYYHFSTYNTAANLGSEMWLDDLESFWQMKGKVNVDLATLTFSANNIKNEYYDITFNIDSGKIIQNASKGPVSKAVTDSISFVAEFSDDPGTKYRLSGYRRTRFSEDDH